MRRRGRSALAAVVGSGLAADAAQNPVPSVTQSPVALAEHANRG